MIAVLVIAALAPAPATSDEAAVKAMFADSCTMCHSSGGDPSDPGALDLSGDPRGLVGRKSVMVDKLLVAPGDPAGSVLLDKLVGGPAMKGELMPEGMDALPPAQIEVVRRWIAALPVDPAPTIAPTPTEATPRESPPRPGRRPFHGTEQIVLPTTTTLGRRTLQYRIDHRFGRIGTERGAFGLDAGVVMSMGLQYGIFDGWDVRLRRTNSRKGWELGTKYVPVRQEAGMPLSFGGYAAVEYFRDFGVANRWVGDFMLMFSRLWLDRWVTMLTVGYSLRTNHQERVIVVVDGQPVMVRDRRDTIDVGFATSVYLGKRKQWGIDLEWVLPVPDGRAPNQFFYRGGDADPAGTKIGAWGLGGSYTTGKHVFKVFLTNNREIHTNLAAAGGQSGNPFSTPGVDSKNPFHRFNFFVGFNLGRNFTLGTRIAQAKAARDGKRGDERRKRGGGE